MDKNEASSFSFTWRDTDASLTVSPIGIGDIRAAGDLYRSISINASNYKSRLAPDSPNSFNRKGGMFILMSEPEIAEKMIDPDEHFLVGKDSSGEMCALTWHTAKPCNSDEIEEIQWYELADADTSPPRERIFELCAQNSLIYSGEIIAAKIKDMPGIAPCMLYCALSMLNSCSFKGICGDVYRVMAYDGDGGRQECELFNYRSFNMLIRSGAVSAGRGPRKYIELPGLSVEIDPDIIYWEIGTVLPMLRNILNDIGITISTDKMEEQHEKTNPA